jgi:predicted deacylase
VAKNSAIKVGDTLVKPGERATVRLPVADLYTGTSLAMPVHVVCGRREGPVLFVSAAIHGDELNGVEVIRRLLKRKALSSIRGTLLAVPIVNVHGFLDQSRYLPDRRDLNRSFPGSRKGSVAARMAYTFMHEIVDKADFGIDLHTGAINRSNLPQIRGNLGDEATLQRECDAAHRHVTVEQECQAGFACRCRFDELGKGALQRHRDSQGDTGWPGYRGTGTRCDRRSCR